MVVVAKVPASTNAVSDRRMCFLPFMSISSGVEVSGPFVLDSRLADIHSSLTLSYQPLDEHLMNPLRLRIAMQQGSCITVRCILIARRVGTRADDRDGGLARASLSAGKRELSSQNLPKQEANAVSPSARRASRSSRAPPQ